MYVCGQYNSEMHYPIWMKLGGYIGYEGGTNRLDFGVDRLKVKVTAEGQSSGPMQIDGKNKSKGYKIKMRPVRAMVCMEHSYKPIYSGPCLSRTLLYPSKSVRKRQ